MTAYYNENDPDCVAWLRELIREGLIADGIVDNRSIADVRGSDLAGFEQCHFFAGVSGWSVALRLAGWPDDKPVWTGSCPCQPFSAAGKQRGFADERHLWPEWQRLIAECRPAIVFGEQVASATEWLRLVRGDLEALGYAVGCMPIQAASAGADHLRDRYWIVADTDEPRESEGREQRGGQQCGTGSDPQARTVGDSEGVTEREPDYEGNAVSTGGEARGLSGGAGDRGNMADPLGKRRRGGHLEWQDATYADAPGEKREWVIGTDGKARPVKSGVRLLADGFPFRVGLLRGFGNAIDPRPASEWIRTYLGAEFDRLNVEN